MREKIKKILLTLLVIAVCIYISMYCLASGFALHFGG